MSKKIKVVVLEPGKEARIAELDSYTVVLESLNSDLYRYCRNIANASSDGGGGSSFTEPVQVHSNIKNGLGIFGTKAVCKTTVTG